MNCDYLPEKEVFYNKLIITKALLMVIIASLHMCGIYLNVKYIRDYHMIHLKVDTVLLANVSEYFREIFLKQYGLDPAYYYASPDLFSESFQIYKYETDNVQESGLYSFVKKGIRGIVSTITHRYAKASNAKILGHDTAKPISSTKYLDANNLYI